MGGAGEYDLIALGETMMALAPPPAGAPHAAPVAADHAGAESNTCVGLARLGFRVAWVSRLGEDAAGDAVCRALEAEGVDTGFVRRDPGRPTGLMLKHPQGVRYYRRGSAACALAAGDLAGVPVDRARAVLVTGVTTLIDELPLSAALALLAAARGLRVVDPNLRRGLWGSARRAERVRGLLPRCDLLLGGPHELAEVCGAGDDPGDLRALARRCASHGPREVVVRAGDRLAAWTARGEWVESGDRRDPDAVDPVGAGDAFNAGYLAVRLRGGGLAAALRAGAACGAAVVARMGDTAGFPRELPRE
jgi:2-dehydro-3-deoxygluconokinase